jgi:citrate synthase
MNSTKPPNGDWLTAEAALAQLGVARQTLYAYVSRGLVQTRPAPDDPRRSLYDPFGIRALVARRQRSRRRHAVAASTINFGEPVLTSRITHIADRRLWYRGQDAIRLAATASLETAAALLWEAPALPLLPASTYHRVLGDGAPIARCLRQVAGLASGPGIWARGIEVLVMDAALTLRSVAEAACDAPVDGLVHQALAAAWGLDAAGADLVRRALVLCADHELNASAFAVRVVASTGAALPCCLLAGLAALSGPLHGGMTERVRALLAEPGMTTDPAAAIAARLARGERLLGFGHPLYPAGDPRAADLLAALGLGPEWQRLFVAVADLTGLQPNIDTALFALQQHLALPPGSALAIFAIGRTTGWIAHALEQHHDGHLIRPRAVYAGPLPEGEALKRAGLPPPAD